MGSVYVTWKGAVRDRVVQKELQTFLFVLAGRSDARLAAPAPPRPAFLELMTAERAKQAPRCESFRTFDEEISGRIVLDPWLARDGQTLLDDVRRAKAELIEVEARGTEKDEAYCLSLDSADSQSCVVLPRLQLYGIDFQLFDPRGLYPGADRMSFVFLQSLEIPSLDGGLAQIESREQCQAYGSEAIRAADWYVSAPNIHLRYYLEEWSDFLLSWVKFFFVPDLVFRRYEDLSQYDATQTFLEQLCREHGELLAKRGFFSQLVDMFEEQADACVRQLGEMG